MDTIIFRTLGAWGAGKGANLLPSEVDSNFWSLVQAIVDLQSNPALPVGIASISVAGTQMTITLTDGTELGPYTLPTLTFRWRGEWTPTTLYAVLDVFTVENVGIFMVEVAHTSGATFDAGLVVGGVPALLQLFGSTDASLSALPDVQLTSLQDHDFLRWVAADAKWENIALGSMAYQSSAAVAITGGTITGMPGPSVASDVATKGYVDGAVTGGASVADSTIMSNISGTTGPATAHTLSAYLDHALATTVRGTLYYRGSAAWVALAPGTAGQFLQTAGAGADPLWTAGGSGVTNIGAGTGISTGGTNITSSGTVSLAPFATGNLLANLSGATAAPIPNTTSAILDATVGNTRGMLAYRGASTWTALAPDTAGKYLKTQGPGADPMWDAPAGSGTVTSVGSGAGLTGGPITSTGSLSLAAIADSTVLANISGSSAAPGATTLTLLLDHVLGAGRGQIIFRGASAWSALAAGTAGQVLTTGGTSADPAWAAGGGGAGLPSGTAGDQLVYVSGAWTAQRPRYIIGAFVPGLLTASQILLDHRVSKAATFPANFGAYLGHTSMARGSANATASTAIDVQKATSAAPGTFSSVGTITIAAGAMVGTFASSGGAAVSFAQGDTLALVGPATPDATFAGFAATLVGYET